MLEKKEILKEGQTRCATESLEIDRNIDTSPTEVDPTKAPDRTAEKKVSGTFFMMEEGCVDRRKRFLTPFF